MSMMADQWVGLGWRKQEPDRKPHSSADECLLTVSYVIHCLIVVMKMMKMMMMKIYGDLW